MSNMEMTTERQRPLLAWAGAAVAAIVGFTVLSAAFDKSGASNDPFLAEVGNFGAMASAAVLLLIGIAAMIRAAGR